MAKTDFVGVEEELENFRMSMKTYGWEVLGIKYMERDKKRLPGRRR